VKALADEAFDVRVFDAEVGDVLAAPQRDPDQADADLSADICSE